MKKVGEKYANSPAVFEKTRDCPHTIDNPLGNTAKQLIELIV